MEEILLQIEEELIYEGILSLDEPQFSGLSEGMCFNKIEMEESNIRSPRKILAIDNKSNLSYCRSCDGFNYNCPNYNPKK